LIAAFRGREMRKLFAALAVVAGALVVAGAASAAVSVSKFGTVSSDGTRATITTTVTCASWELLGGIVVGPNSGELYVGLWQTPNAPASQGYGQVYPRCDATTETLTITVSGESMKPGPATVSYYLLPLCVIRWEMCWGGGSGTANVILLPERRS
jgi:hypothetical protein